MANIATNLTATTVSFSAPRQLSDQNSQGTVLGASSTDLISFFNAPAQLQQAVGSSTAAVAFLDNGVLTKYQITNATSAPGASTTLETTSTVTGIQATDVIAVNKPAAQAGLGVAGYRVSAANTIGINYTNISSGAITTTAEAYDVIGISSNYTTTQALSPAAVPATPSGNEQVFTVNGAVPGMFPIVNKPTNQAGLGISNVRIPAPNQVAITFLNNSSGAITPTAAETYSFAFLPTLQPSDRALVYKFNQASTAVAQTSSAEVTTAITGLLATDIVSGASKPSAQTGLGVGGYRVSSAGNIAIQLTNAGAAVTSTAETYAATVLRQVAKSPFVVTTAALAPVSVAAGTTAEQTFTVNSLNVSTSVLVSKPTFTPGLHVVGSRVSAASTLAITYQNSNSSAVVPPAETYTIAAVPLQGPGAVTTAGSSTNSISVGFNGADSASALLRAALIAYGLVALT